MLAIVYELFATTRLLIIVHSESAFKCLIGQPRTQSICCFPSLAV